MGQHTVLAPRGFPVLFGFCLFAGACSNLQADQPPGAVSAIQKLGGSVHPVGDDEWEVEFHIHGRDLTDQGLVHVALLRNLVSLNLRDTKITSAGLVHLKGLTTLRSLHLERTQIGDEGIMHLAGLVHLEYLNLYATNITDRSLEYLTRLEKLHRLYLWQTKVTDAGEAKLVKTLPGLRIIRGVDLSKLPTAPPIKPRTSTPVLQKWIAATDQKPPKSKLGSNITVTFENKMARRVKLFWISYGGELKLYAELEPGATRRQNSYSEATWLITDEMDHPLGYFITTKDKEALAVIPELK